MIELDGTKINWYHDRIRAWRRGERIAPITIDMALTRSCNMACEFCYGKLQKNENHKITEKHMTRFLEDVSTIGVKGVSLVSDGESSISPAFVHTIQYGASLGLSMASGSNAYLLSGDVLRSVLPSLTYLRVNISAGEEMRYREIMGARKGMFEQVVDNIREMVKLKRSGISNCTIGMQMVFMPSYTDQLIPLAQLAVSLGVDYLIIKHCSDDEQGSLGVDYGGYKKTYDRLKEAESMSTPTTAIIIKWSKIEGCTEAGAERTYQRCYAPPFIIQLSGSGLVAPCGMFFNEKYKHYHMGNITQQRFKDIWRSDRYWSVIRELASPRFNAQTMCGCLCLQHNVNTYLDDYKKGNIKLVDPTGQPPEHLGFV